MKYFTDKKHIIRGQYKIGSAIDGTKIDDPKIFINELNSITENLKLGICGDIFNNYYLRLELWIDDGPSLEIENVNQKLFNELVANIEIYGSLKEVYNAINNLPADIKLKLALE